MFKNLFSKKTLAAPDTQTQTPPVVELPPNAFQIAVQYHQQGDLAQASAWYRQILQAKPDHADAYNNLGLLLQDQEQMDAAVECFRSALAITPDDVEVCSNLGQALFEQGKLDEAAKVYRQALSVAPNAAVYFNLGIALQEQQKFDDAIDCYHKALAVDANLINVRLNLGTALKDQGKLEKAIEYWQAELLINPDSADTLDNLLYTQLQCCEWSQYQLNTEKMFHTVITARKKYRPFVFLVISDSAAMQLECNKIFANKYPLAKTPLWSGQRYQHQKIRIAYISADFRDHPMSYLMAGFFEQHDKDKFETFALSLIPESKTAIGQRIKNAFNQYIDVSQKTDHEIALLLRNLEIDIAVDLMGFTQGCRPAIYAYRPAPIQVNYLGFPGTLGANFIDYIIADNYVIPEDQQRYYTEKVAYLPDTYWPNDSSLVIANQIPTRSEVGLPEQGFVFCCFNSAHKITPQIFSIWMRLLLKVENSVLWLLEANSTASLNLKKQAEKHGVAADRLVFAPRMKVDAHLARQKLADLVLDTLPYNAHTTSSDALWAGLPVITYSGNSFASRVAGSLLHAIGLPELIVADLQAYENLALKLATTPDLLAEIRAKLAANRTTHPLFNTDRFRRHMEAAYITMWERYQDGKPPASFAVPPVD